jgi:hypothetical protein
LILDGHVTGFFRKGKPTPLNRLAPKGKGILMGDPACIQKWISAGRPAVTKEWKGETVQMPEAFDIKSGKSPNFGRIEANVRSANDSRIESGH